jgi:putative transcriptional regulator
VIAVRKALIARRKKSGYTQAKVAEGAGINRASYVHIERGTRNPSLEVALKIAEFLKCKVDDIFSASEVSESDIEPTGTTG